MYAFYLVRGHSKSELEKLSYIEKIFYIESMKFHFEQEADKYKTLFSGGK